MDILLVNAPVKERRIYDCLHPPLGLAYIASVLLRAGYSVSAIDFNVTGLNPRRLTRILERETPRILGISAYTKTYSNGLVIAELAKQLLPDVTVVMGGAHSAVMYEEVLREKSIDVVVRGEGEYTMLELADCLIRNKGNLAQIKGIAYRDNGALKTTPERPFIADIDELPFPARWLFPLPLYAFPGSVLISRGGCPFKCRFCAVNNVWKGRRKYRRPEKVVEEILYIFKHKQAEAITFADDAFTLDRGRVIELCGLLKDVKERLQLRWKCATRVDLVDRELLEKMHEAGCYSICFGVEAGSQKIFDSIGKGITLEQVRDAVRATLDAGIGVACAFMFPHPEDTEETIREQKQFMKELAELGITLSLAATTPYPGTYSYDNADELDIKILTSSWDEYDDTHLMITTKYLSEEKLKSLLEELVQYVGLVEAGGNS